MIYGIGIDCGSTFCKAALFSEENGLMDLRVIPSGWDMAGAASALIDQLADGCGKSANSVKIVATGYGREQVSQADKLITEISCHAKGAEFLAPGVRGLIDIGGQDYKVIAINDGKVLSFMMNDKCAAGSGRFLEMILQRLELDLAGLDEMLAQNKYVSLNSTCAVFAESEIIGLLAKGCSREEILGAVLRSMAAKIASQAARVNLEAPLYLSGGLWQCNGVCNILSTALGVEVKALPNGLHAGAVGAAILAAQNK